MLSEGGERVAVVSKASNGLRVTAGVSGDDGVGLKSLRCHSSGICSDLEVLRDVNEFLIMMMYLV